MQMQVKDNYANSDSQNAYCSMSPHGESILETTRFNTIPSVFSSVLLVYHRIYP